MSSQSRATRDNQRKLYDERLQARQAVLEKRGMAAADFKKDKVYEHLKAKQAAIAKAIAAIDAGLARAAQAKVKEEIKAPPPPAPAEKKEKKEKPEKAAKAAKAAPAKADEAAPARARAKKA